MDPYLPALGGSLVVLSLTLYTLRLSTPNLPYVDLSICLLLAGFSTLSFPYSILLASTLAGLSLSLLYISYGTCRWLSLAHTQSHSSPAAAACTSLTHRRNMGRKLPCPYPDAWYSVALSEELAPGAVIDVTVCGRSLVVFRASQAPHGVSILDAYCTHNGAHLAHGGATLNAKDCIRCPFHGWCYDSQGKLVETGTGETPPSGSDLKAWPALERNGVISVWMSAEGHGVGWVGGKVGVGGEGGETTTTTSTPWFHPPILPELTPAAFTYHGMTENLVPAIIFELPENGADIGHLTALHSAFVVAALRPALSHAWEGKWCPHESEPHLARLSIEQTMVLCGFPLPGAVEVNILQCGPSQVYLFFALPGIGRVVITETVTPVEPTLQRVLHACHAEPGVPRLVAKVLLASVIRAYEQDVAVWAHKRYEPNPRLTASESSVKTYRGWVRQFYSSPQAITFEQARRAQVKLDLGLPDDCPLDW